MANPFAQEYTPELTSGYLASLTRPIDEEERKNIANAGAKYKAGGLGAQASYGAEVGAIESGATKARADTISGFDLNVADRKYSERMTDEKQTFDDEQRSKTEDFQRQMMELGYQHEIGMLGAEQGFQRVQGQQGAVWGMGSALVSGASSAATMGIMKSDATIKTDIRMVGQVGPVVVYAYSFRQDCGDDLPKGPQVGVLAQEVREHYPEVVSRIGEHLAVDYTALDARLRADFGRGL